MEINNYKGIRQIKTIEITSDVQLTNKTVVVKTNLIVGDSTFKPLN